MNSDKFVKIAVLENEIEARLVRSILADRSLPHMIRSYHDTAYDGLYQFQLGWGELRAPEYLKQEIECLLQSIRQSDNEKTAPDGCS
jgi:hypothetical protein